MTDRKAPRAPQVFDADDPALRPAKPAGDPEAPASGFGDADPRSGVGDATDRDAGTPGAQPPDATRDGAVGRGFRWGALLFSAMFALALLAAGVWFGRFTSVALARDDWVGWIAQGLLGLLLLAAGVLLFKELFGILRMGRISRIRRDAERALATGDRSLEVRAVRALKGLARGRRQARWDLAKFREEERFMTEPGKLLGLADRVLLSEADKQARRVIFESARRVGVVTAVVPVAFLVMLFVLAENVRMVRRLADAYGGRPGAIGGVRLLWRVIMHVAATGAIALTDDLFGQFLGQDIVRRISRRLGEGAFVGALTARLGVAAVAVCRPLPFIEAQPLRSRHVVRELFPELQPGELMRSAFRKSDEAGETGRQHGSTSKDQD